MQLNHLDSDTAVTGRNDAAAILRAIQPTDEAGLQRFIRDLSPASRHMRFMRGIRELPQEMLRRFANPAPGREAALVAAAPSGGIVGLSQYVADEEGAGCEFAVVVSDAWQRQGLGTGLLTALMELARDNGMARMHADVLADNHAMRSLARKLGCDLRTDPQPPFLVQVSRSLEPPQATPFDSLAARTGNRWHLAGASGLPG